MKPELLEKSENLLEEVGVNQTVLTDEIAEKVDVEALAAKQNLVHERETVPKPVPKKSVADLLLKHLTFERATMIAAFVLSIVALTVSLARTELTIGQGHLFLEDASVNKMLGNLLQNDLGRQIPDNVNLRELSVRVEIHCDENESGPSKVSDIGDADVVTAEVVFMPQTRIVDFAEDVRSVLDVMLEQSAKHEFEYDTIVFSARDTLTNMEVTLSGRYSKSITTEEIAALTYYFGEIDVKQGELPDIIG